MKVTTFGKASAGVAALALSLGVCSAAFASGPTANDEDPTAANVAASTSATIVGVGSDTIQDVMYGIAKDINTAAGKQVIQSWTATGTPATITTQPGGTSFTRPVDSGSGFTALKAAIGLAPGGTGLPALGDVDFARASGTQGTTKKTDGTGVIVNVPFAIDSISFAVPAGSPFASTNGGAGLTITDLYNIYTGTDKYIGADGTLGADAEAAGTGAEPIWALLPKSGSGSRNFFLQQLYTQGSGFPSAIGSNGKGDVAAWNTNTGDAVPYIGNTDKNHNPIQEHDATALLTGTPAGVAAIAPFSGAKYIGYADNLIADPSGKVAGTDYKLLPFDSTVSGHTGAVLPYTGTGTSLAPNPAYATYAKQGTEAAFALTREVFNIIPRAAVVGGGTSAVAKFNTLYKTFVGPNSSVCQDSATITKYGFSVDPDCGNTTKFTYDDLGSSTSTAQVTSAPKSVVAGKPAAITVSVSTSANDSRGAVVITAGGKSYTGTIAKGATSTTISIPTTAAGTITYTGSFTSQFAGVAPSPLVINGGESGTITVTKAPIVKVSATVKATAKKVKHTKKAKVAVTVTAKGVTPSGKVTVTIKKGSKVTATVKNKALKKGKVTVTLPKKLKKGSYKVYVSYTGDTKVKAVTSKSVATLKVS